MNDGRWNTILIGISETLMAIWILLKVLVKLNVLTQILVIAIMNFLEYLLAPDLLLWGKANALFAFLFLLLIYFNYYFFNKQKAKA